MPKIDILTGLNVVGQFALDTKKYFNTFAELIDLGASDVNAYKYYESMIVICNETKTQYIWRSPIGEEADGALSVNFTYPDGVIVEGVDYSLKEFNFFPYNNVTVGDVYPVNTVIIGSVVHVTNYDYFCQADRYVIDGALFSTHIEATVSLTPSDATYDRIDKIVINNDETFSVVTGVAALNPQAPDINDTTQVELTFIYVKAGSTSAEVVTELVYDENVGSPAEWDVYDIVGNVVVDSTDAPNVGTKCIKFTAAGISDAVRLEQADLIPFTAETNLIFDIIFDDITIEPFVRIATGNGSYARPLTATLPQYGLDLLDTTNWQTVSIPLGDPIDVFPSFDRITLANENANGSFRIDNVRIQTGIQVPDNEKGEHITRTSEIINDGADGENPYISFNNIYTGNAIINGGVIWLQDLDYYIWATAYIVDNIFYDTPINGNVTLDPADPTNDRIDVFIINNDGAGNATVGVIKGTAEASPVKPSIDLDTQVEVSFKLLQANETVPSTTNNIIYDQNLGSGGSEWDNSSLPAGGNLADATDPFNDTLSINVPTPVDGAKLTFDSGAVIPYVSNNLIIFALKTAEAWGGNARLKVRLFSGNASAAINFTRGSITLHGFNHSKFGTWQIVAIPMSNWGITGNIDKFELEMLKLPTLDVDYIYGQIDGIAPPPTTGKEYFTELLDTPEDYVGQGGKLVKVKADESGLEFMDGVDLRDLLDVNSIQLDTTPDALPSNPGLIQWNATEDTVDVTANGVTYQLGQEIAPLVRNSTGVIITNGTPVMFAGTLGASGRVLVQPAIADNSIPSSYALGVATQDIANGADGHVTWFGKVRDIDTTGTPYGEVWSDSDIIYVSAVTAGYLTNVKPVAPNSQIFIGVVINAHATNGTMFVRPSWRGNITDLSDVNGTTLDTDGQILVWDDASKYFDFTKNINDYLLKTDNVPAIENRYADIAALLADQAGQTDKGVEVVLDASADTTVDNGYAYYEYLGTTVGDLTDYRKISDESAGTAVEIGYAIGIDNDPLIVNSSAFTFRMPYGVTLIKFVSTLDVGPDGSPVIIDLLKEGVSVLSTKSQIDVETRAVGTVTLTGGGSGSVDGITVDGVEVMSGAEAFATDLDTTANNVAINITANTSIPNYTATATGGVISIQAIIGGEASNGLVVISATTVITSANVNFTGGGSNETSNTSAIPSVISDNDLSINSEMTVAITQVGSLTIGSGLKIYILGKKQ